MQWLRLPRAMARFLFVAVVGAVATVAGAAGALTQTDAGHRVLATVLRERAGALVRGSLTVARIDGDFVRSLSLDSLEVRDTSGALLALFPRVDARWRLRNLLQGRILLEELRLERPVLRVVQHRGGRMNFEEVLRLGEGPPGGRGPLLEFRNLAVVDGEVEIRTSWSPPGELRTAAARDSALAAQRAVPGRRIEPGPGAEGLQQVRQVTNLQARLPRLRIRTPDKAPLLAVIDTMAFEATDPLLRVVHLQGEVTQARDTLWFALERAALPGTVGQADGLAAWPQDTLLFNFSFDAERVSLADLRFVSPAFPDFTGRGRLEAYSYDGTLSEYRITAFEAGDAASDIRGDFVALLHRRRGLGFRGLDLMLRNLDLDVPRAYLDTIPFTGRLSGRLRADGYFDAMQVGIDWSFLDRRVPGRPVSRLAMTGEMALGGAEGMVFRRTRVSDTDLDLPTVRLAAPAVVLEGRARASGTLDGPWRNAVFTGEVRLRDGERPESRLTGRIRLDTRDTLVAMDADLQLDPLDFEGVRRGFPTLAATGQLRGAVHLEGSVDRLQVVADVTGQLGMVRARGTLTLLPPRFGASPLALDVRGLDLSALRGSGPTTRLNGQVVFEGQLDTLVAPSGRLAMLLGPGLVREVALDSLVLSLAVQDSLITVDSAVVGWFGGGVRAVGTLGWASPRQGRLAITGESSSLAAFDSLATVLAGVPASGALDGVASAQLAIGGHLDSLVLEGAGRLQDLRWGSVRIPTAASTMRLERGARSALTLSASVDSLMAQGRTFTGLALEASGLLDSLAIRTRARGTLGAALEAEGRYLGGGGQALAVDRLSMEVRRQRWALGAPFTAALRDSVISVTPVHLGREDGGAAIHVEGTVPYRSDGQLDVRVFGLDLRDVSALVQRDTADLRGLLSADLEVGGTASAPVIRGTAALTGPVFGDFRSPLVQVALLYRDEQLQSGLRFWRTGSPVIEASTELPLDLAWRRTRAGSRQLPGALRITARADSMDLALLEAFSDNLRRMRGRLDVDVVVAGTWDRPALGGSVTISGGGATVPGLGVRYGPIDGRLRLAGDAIAVDTLRIAGQDGAITVGGQVALERLTSPRLDLEARARRFAVMDVPGYLTLELDADAQLRGPFWQPVLSGRGTVRNTVLYFADLVSKSIVNLEDPLYADLVDTLALRTGGLRAPFQSRFLDSLTIRDLTFRAAEGVWLRSTEANIQLEGEARVNKVRQLYRLDGAFNAVRGTYTLRVGPISRAFDVTRGVVRYVGDPDLNADLDIEARHVIKASSAEAAARDLEITARIGGMLRTPTLALESSIRPPLSQSDIISLLLLGQTVNSQVASSAQSDRFAQALSLLAGTLTSEIERSLMQSGRAQAAPDLIEIRPGLGYGGVASGASLTRLSAGWNIGTRWFVSLNAGFCPGFQQFDFRNFGANLDYRLNRTTSLTFGGEPIQTCLAGAAGGIAAKRYQLGGDLRWAREY